MGAMKLGDVSVLFTALYPRGSGSNAPSALLKEGLPSVVRLALGRTRKVHSLHFSAFQICASIFPLCFLTSLVLLIPKLVRRPKIPQRKLFLASQGL